MFQKKYSLFILLLLFFIDHLNANESKFKISIIGVNKDSIQQILLDSLTVKYHSIFRLSSKNTINYFLKDSCKEIKNLLEPYGYYNAKIKTKVLFNNILEIKFYVNLGDPIKVNHINIKIPDLKNDDTIVSQLKKSIPLKEKDILTQDKYEKTKNIIKDVLFSKGYLDVTWIKHKIFIDKTDYTANILFILNAKERYSIGDIDIKQYRFKYSKNLINNLLRFKKSDFFSKGYINSSISIMQSSGYFSEVRIIPNLKDRDMINKTVDLDISLTSEFSRTYSYGIGYGSFTGIRGSFGITFPHVTQSGQMFKFNILASPANSSFQASYIFPGVDPVYEYWSITAQQSYIDTNSFQERQTNFGLNLTNRYDRFNLTLSIQQYLVNYITDAQPVGRDSAYLVPGLNISYDGTVNNGFWKRGLIFDNVTQISFTNFISDKYFVRSILNTNYFLPINKEWNRLVLGANVGFIDVDNIQDIAPNFRFYAGGIGVLLGYPYLSQGPTIDGNVIGGKTLLTGFVGLEQRIYQNFSTIVYYNQGDAGNNFNINNFKLRAAGIGFSYKSFLGPLVMYLSRTLNQSQHWRIDFSVGMNL